MPTTTNSWKVSERITELLLPELDPRVHPETKAFFENVKPEVADQIAEFYNRAYRGILEGVFYLRRTMEHYADHFTNGKLDPAAESDGSRAAFALLLSIAPEHMRGFEEIEPIMGALRGFEDDGLAIVLGTNVHNVAGQILDDEGLNAIVERLIVHEAE